MRVESYLQVNQLYKTTQQNKLKKYEVDSASTDKFEISAYGKDYQIANKAVKAAPEVREEKVNEIREAMASGTYQVTMEDVAEKLLGSWF